MENWFDSNSNSNSKSVRTFCCGCCCHWCAPWRVDLHSNTAAARSFTIIIDFNGFSWNSSSSSSSSSSKIVHYHRRLPLSFFPLLFHCCCCCSAVAAASAKATACWCCWCSSSSSPLYCLIKLSIVIMNRSVYKNIIILWDYFFQKNAEIERFMIQKWRVTRVGLLWLLRTLWQLERMPKQAIHVYLLDHKLSNGIG